MLPTPDTSHVPYERVYEPSEDSFLLLDTLSSAPERRFLQHALAHHAAPLVVEVGTGSGVVVAFVHAHAHAIFGTRRVLAAGVDVSAYACRATARTVAKAQADSRGAHGVYLGSCMGDLAAPWRDASIDVLIFNPPYVPTPGMPSRPEGFSDDPSPAREPSFDDDSYLLSLSYAGGMHGMETTDRLIESLPRILSPRGCAYILLCAQNKPEDVKRRIQGFGPEWRALTVGSSGKTAGWERLQVVRIWRDVTR
ncbi:ERF1 methyltransferase catalytic subunit MTQ2 [Tolypocladium paradoxum]|uniref:ERF1 methyltransferase catalytic subunit MTQ2 n=1 Tax=Tolypocladium paradoxum TaxID=94208 RepID=A0A2S4KKU9_9HYPO|nr:ERF1 methyltransferase catalytic subunit MTQ2 [Tolypocladium paradoxum]